MNKNILVLNGPNLNLLGEREPEIYGSTTLAEIEERSILLGKALGYSVDFKQSNHEGQLVDWIQEVRQSAQGIIINPAAYTHTSIALLDALKAFEGYIIELHLSNTHQREAYRHHSYVSQRANAIIMGCGVNGYELAIRQMASAL